MPYLAPVNYLETAPSTSGPRSAKAHFRRRQTPCRASETLPAGHPHEFPQKTAGVPSGSKNIPRIALSPLPLFDRTGRTGPFPVREVRKPAPESGTTHCRHALFPLRSAGSDGTLPPIALHGKYQSLPGAEAASRGGGDGFFQSIRRSAGKLPREASSPVPPAHPHGRGASSTRTA